MCKQNTYIASYRCSNCEWDGDLDLPKGTIKPKTTQCPNCGCVTATPVNDIKPPWKPTPYPRPKRPIDSEPTKWIKSWEDKNGSWFNSY